MLSWPYMIHPFFNSVHEAQGGRAFWVVARFVDAFLELEDTFDEV